MIGLQIALASLLITMAPQRGDMASIQGSVRDTESGRPLTGATIELRHINSDGKTYSYFVSTSGNGDFEFPQVTPGDYRIFSRFAGYSSLEYGQHTPYGSGLSVHLGAGDSKRNIRFSLTRGGVITGRVISKDGDPANTAIIQAIEVSNRAGQPAYTTAQSTFVNDLGEYRLFELHPGRYILRIAEQGNVTLIDSPVLLANVAASLELSTFTSLRRTSSLSGQFSPIFYPGTADAREASTIVVTPGSVLNGVNVTVARATTHHIRGLAKGTNVHIQMIPLDPSLDLSAAPRDVSVTNGTFDIANVTPGRYLLRARTINEQGDTAIDVRDQDVNDVFLEPRSGIELPTYVQIAGRITGSVQDNDYQFIRFRLMNDPPISGISGATYSTFPDGTVNFDLVPGQNVRIELFPVKDAPPELQDAYIRSIQMGTHDVLNDGLKYTGDPDAKMEIVIGLKAGVVSGTVLEDDAMTPSINTFVVLVPDEARRGRPDAFRNARTDDAGRFQIGKIPPGEYKVFAWNDVDEDEWLDSDFVKKYEEEGTPVHVEELSRPSLTLQVLP